MPVQVLMPALSPTMTEGKLSRWVKHEGDAVNAGDVIAEIETDKATMEVEAVDEGILGKILIAEGTESVAVNTPIALLLEEGESAKDLKSVQVGVKQTKGSAAAPSNENQQASYGATTVLAPVDADEPAMGETVKLTVREALRDAMAEEMRRDADVLVMGEEVAEYQGAYKVTQNLLQEFGASRVIDTPITEHGFAGLAVGAAFMKLKPVVEFMTFNFAMQAIDQIINSAAKTLYMSGGQMGCPIVFRGPNGAASRVAAQHSQCYASWYAHCPGLKVVAPYSAADCKGLLKAAIRDPNPIIFLENEITYGMSFDVPVSQDYIVPIGKAKVVREGTDVTLTAFSIMVKHALEAADALAEMGISAEVIDLRTIRPLDTATIVRSVQKTNRMVSLEEGWPMCGIGSELAAVIMEQAFDDLDAPVLRVTAKDVPLPYAANLEKLALPQIADIISTVKAVTNRA
jgi:pyruvate dehydrogenase E1 component beta subunit